MRIKPRIKLTKNQAKNTTLLGRRAFGCGSGPVVPPESPWGLPPRQLLGCPFRHIFGNCRWDSCDRTCESYRKLSLEMHHQSTMVKTKEKSIWMTILQVQFYGPMDRHIRSVGSSTIACKLRHTLLATDPKYIKKYTDEGSDMESHREPLCQWDNWTGHTGHGSPSVISEICRPFRWSCS